MSHGLTLRTPALFGRDPISDTFDRFFRTWANMPASDGYEAFDRQEWVPPVDLRETDDAFTLVAELPGLSKDEIDISLEDNVLTLSGERQFEKASEGDDYHRVERLYGKFRRSFTLPTGVDAEAVKATFKKGLLTLELPKSAAAKPRKIAVS